jgi:hypothetical protein
MQQLREARKLPRPHAPELAPDGTADQIAGMAVNPLCPAFIDPPGPYASLDEWLTYREGLRRMTVPGLKPFLDEADEAIAHLTPPEK